MKKSISAVLGIIFLGNAALADCDFSTIKVNPDGSRTYSLAQHICVGQAVQANTTKDLQIQDLTGAVNLKDIALKAADQRADTWMNADLKLESNIQSIDKNKKDNEYLAFGLGILVTYLAVSAAAKLSGR
jgi:uncharacterized protein involved in high-affinity Fe2+ transport